jgi:CheY-like chemotaxis protein
VCVTGTGVITADNDLRVVLMNEPARQMLGVTGDTATGKDLTSVFSCPDPEMVAHIRQSLGSIIATRSQLEKIVSVPVKTGNGIIVSCAVTLEPIVSQDKKSVGVAITFRDTARTSAHMGESAISPENIEAYTMLVRGVAHDFNNMLSPILANLQLAKMETFADSHMFSWLDSAEDGVIHARDLSQQLLTLTAGKDLALKTEREMSLEKPADHALPAWAGSEIPATRKKRTSAKKKILLMDDEEAILSATGEMLRFLDYSVEVVQNGDAAIELYRKAQDDGVPFDAVILDITVPRGMGAKEALPLLRKIDPAVKAIISSGYSTNPMIVDCRSFGFTAAIVKPYGFRELDAALRDAFEPE